MKNKFKDTEIDLFSLIDNFLKNKKKFAVIITIGILLTVVGHKLKKPYQKEYITLLLLEEVSLSEEQKFDQLNNALKFITSKKEISEDIEIYVNRENLFKVFTIMFEEMLDMDSLDNEIKTLDYEITQGKKFHSKSSVIFKISSNEGDSAKWDDFIKKNFKIANENSRIYMINKIQDLIKFYNLVSPDKDKDQIKKINKQFEEGLNGSPLKDPDKFIAAEIKDSPIIKLTNLGEKGMELYEKILVSIIFSLIFGSLYVAIEKKFKKRKKIKF